MSAPIISGADGCPIFQSVKHLLYVMLLVEKDFIMSDC